MVVGMFVGTVVVMVVVVDMNMVTGVVWLVLLLLFCCVYGC